MATPQSAWSRPDLTRSSAAMFLRCIPHQTQFDLPAEAVVPLPADIPLSRAVLAANVETALNATWDAAPGPSGRIAVVGAGVVGALVGYLCAQIEGAEVTLIDIDPTREALARVAGTEVRRACGCARRLRFRFSLQRLGRWAHHRAQHRRRRGGHRRAELVRSRHRRGAARRRVPQPPPETNFEPGRQSGAVAPGRVHASSTARSRDQALRASAARPRCLRPAIAFGELPARLADILKPRSGVLCQLISYS